MGSETIIPYLTWEAGPALQLKHTPFGSGGRAWHCSYNPLLGEANVAWGSSTLEVSLTYINSLSSSLSINLSSLTSPLLTGSRRKLTTVQERPGRALLPSVQCLETILTCGFARNNKEFKEHLKPGLLPWQCSPGRLLALISRPFLLKTVFSGLQSFLTEAVMNFLPLPGQATLSEGFWAFSEILRKQQ